MGTVTSSGYTVFPALSSSQTGSTMDWASGLVLVLPPRSERVSPSVRQRVSLGMNLDPTSREMNLQRSRDR